MSDLLDRINECVKEFFENRENVVTCVLPDGEELDEADDAQELVDTVFGGSKPFQLMDEPDAVYLAPMLYYIKCEQKKVLVVIGEEFRQEIKQNICHRAKQCGVDLGIDDADSKNALGDSIAFVNPRDFVSDIANGQIYNSFQFVLIFGDLESVIADNYEEDDIESLEYDISDILDKKYAVYIHGTPLFEESDYYL